MQLVRMIYRSFAAPGIGLQDLRAILKTSQVNNDQRELTGILILHDGWFLQALEGPQTAINHRFMRIAADERHHTVQILKYTPVARRFFGQWKMKGVGTATLGTEMADLVAIHGAGGRLLLPDDPDAAFALLHHAAQVTAD